MAIEVTMPQMGADMTEGTIVRWIKQVGDEVKRGEIIAEIETDKATIELEAFDSGTLIEHVVPEGETVDVNTVIALLGDAAEASARKEDKPAPKATAATNGRSEAAPGTEDQQSPATVRTSTRQEPLKRPIHQVSETAPAVVTAYVDDDAAPVGRIRISPVARRIAMEEGIDVRAITGSGPDGRILRRDVEAAMAGKASEKPATPRADAKAQGAADKGVPAEVEGEIEKADAVPTPAETPKPSEIAASARPAAKPEPARTAEGAEPLSRMRQAIARRMTMSKQQQPHYYLTLDVDMNAALAFREQLNGAASDTQRVSINDLIVKACAIAIARHPKFNAEFSENGLVMNEAINVCIGIALDEGLIAPAILDAGNKSLGRIAVETKDLVNRAKAGKLRSDEYSDGTFTITNLGAYGVESLIGIINPPQAAILGVGSVMPAAVVRDGQVVVRSIMKLALSADHRVTDGAEGARFIKEIQSLLENPASLAL